MKILHGLILLICTTFTLTAQTNYYVSNAGSNNNSGTSEVNAFEDIQFAIDSASAGDTVFVVGGTYSENLIFSKSGITLMSNGNGSVELFSSGNPFLDSGDTIITIIDQADITISGFNIAGAFGDGATGVFIGGTSQNITLTNDTIGFIATSFLSIIPSQTDRAFGVSVYGGDDVTAINGVSITNTLLSDNGVGIGSEISIGGNVGSFTISTNQISGSDNTGIELISAANEVQGGLISGNNIRQGAGDAIHIDGAASTLIERNLFLSNGGAAVNIAAGDGITVRNNLISANEGSAIALGGTGTANNCMVRNNSTYNNGIDSTNAELSILSATSSFVINNIFSNVSGRILSATSGVGLILNYNLYNTSGTPAFDFDGGSYSTLEDYSMTTGQDTNSIYGDPGYQSTGQGALNFHLTMASPAINAGDPNTVVGGDEVDAYGDLRIVDDVIDMGASEFPDVLPVTYLSPFKANLINDIVQMDWHTAEEINSDHFEVQRSTDLENWTTIVSMPSVGESHLYEAADREPLDGTTYYRLMQVDLDGSTDLSHIEIISVNKSTETRIFPNPAASWLRIEAGIGATVSEVRIFDLTGKMIMRSFDEGTNVTVDLTQLSTGTYVVQYRTNEGVKATKIQKN